jgi:TRAP-type C4-dicarboxylate transport system permease small subunit
MMLVTVADVVLRAAFNFPLLGTAELVEFGLACAVFFGLPAVFLRDEHLVVDVIDHFAPARVVRWLDLLGALVSLGVLAVMGWQMLPVARSMYEFGDVTSSLSIPKIYYWIPVLVGVFASAAATLFFIARWRRQR